MRAGKNIGARHRSRGFTYLALLLIVAAMGGGFAAYGELASRSMQREKEAELLFVGDEYRRAIGTYYENSPAGHKRYPQSLEALLKDERFVFNRRYLRKLYADPMTASRDWGLVEAPEGGIMGVYSRSPGEPIKTGDFSAEDRAFDKATRYSEWRFVHERPPLTAAAPRK